jgi:AAA family ATP:ADP antiporter
VAKKFPRNRLVISVTLFFVSHLVLFYLAGFVPAIRANLGLLFYLWVGIFNMMVVAQFWAFANDIYTEEQGKRLFALIGLGASVGAALGTQVAELLIKPLGLYQLLLISAGLLALCAFITQFVHVRESSREETSPSESKPPEEPTEPDDSASEKPSKDGAFSMVWRYRYLRLVALFSLVFTFVNTNGEYMLGSLFKGRAQEVAQSEVGPADGRQWRRETQDAEKLIDDYIATHPEIEEVASRSRGRDEAALALARKERAGQWIGIAYSKFFFWVNVLGVLIQTFLVSRLVKYLGFRIAFFILPVVAFADSLLFLVFPLLLVLRIGKTAENATD